MCLGSSTGDVVFAFFDVFPAILPFAPHHRQAALMIMPA